MAKSRHKRKKLSGYYIQRLPKLNKHGIDMLLEDLEKMQERTPKTKQFTANALRLQAKHGSSINILKKLRQAGYVMHPTNN